MAGYSGKPLAEKLGIKAGWAIAVLGAPRGYRRTLGALPARVRLVTRASAALPFIHFFTKRRAELERRLPGLLRVLEPAGALWVSWPKGSSGVATDVTEDVIRRVALPTGLVDVKVCAIDDVWSGLKLVRRLRERGMS